MMSVITNMNITSIDLNLFLVLHHVLVERSATRAARQLHVTQSAVSNALARLRRLIDDPLVIRTAAGLVPTPRAARLAPYIARAVADLDAAMAIDARFDPRETTRRLTMACSDYEETLLLPTLAARFARAMPRAELRIVTVEAY